MRRVLLVAALVLSASPAFAVYDEQDALAARESASQACQDANDMYDAYEAADEDLATAATAVSTSQSACSAAGCDSYYCRWHQLGDDQNSDCASRGSASTCWLKKAELQDNLGEDEYWNAADKQGDGDTELSNGDSEYTDENYHEATLRYLDARDAYQSAESYFDLARGHARTGEDYLDDVKASIDTAKATHLANGHSGGCPAELGAPFN